LSPRTTAVWWIVIRLRVWGMPPGRGARAPQDSLHNSTPDAALTADVIEGTAPDGGLAVGPESGPALAVGGVVLTEEVGPEVGSVVQALTLAAAKPAVPASRSSRRRLIGSRPPTDPSAGGMSITSRYETRSPVRAAGGGAHGKWLDYTSSSEDKIKC